MRHVRKKVVGALLFTSILVFVTFFNKKYVIQMSPVLRSDDLPEKNNHRRVERPDTWKDETYRYGKNNTDFEMNLKGNGKFLANAKLESSDHKAVIDGNLRYIDTESSEERENPTTVNSDTYLGNVVNSTYNENNKGNQVNDLKRDKCTQNFKTAKTDYRMAEILNKVQHEKGRSYNYHTNPDNSSYLDVIIIPQSHNDPGWLMPFEAYYKNKTVNIINNMVKYLAMYKKMTMIWPEVIFLERWWSEASFESRQKLKALIESGRLEIVSGGWVSPDEATSHYYTVLDQLIEGHQWLKKNIGIQPVNTWPLDQFGYSSSLPYIWKKAGMNNLGILRVTQNVKSYFAREKIMSFIWRQPWDFNGDNDVLCHIEAYKWFVTEVSCGPSSATCSNLLFHKRESRMTMPKLLTMSESIVEQFKLKAALYKQKVIIVALGNDFAYDTANEWRAQYNNVTALINYVNDRKSKFGVTMRFGTVRDYFDKIKSLQESGSCKTFSGDFFTYAEDDMCTEYWSGYFSTRAFDKRIGRALMEHVKSAEILTSFALSNSENGNQEDKVVSMLKELEVARRTLALFQHHDAITGTSTHSTATDYRERIHGALVSCQKIMTQNIHKIIQSKAKFQDLAVIPLIEQTSYLDQVRRKTIDFEKDKLILVWNSFEHTRNEIVCLLTNTSDSGFSVTKISGQEVEYQISPYLNGEGNLSSEKMELCFKVSVPPYGGSFYRVRKSNTDFPVSRAASVWSSLNSNHKFSWPQLNVSDKIIFKNKYLTVYFHTSGGLHKLCIGNSNKSCSVISINWSYFMSSADAYVFVPYGMPRPLDSLTRNVFVISGNLVSRVVISTHLYKQTFTLYNSDNLQGMTLHIENNVSLVKSIENGKEILMNIVTNLNTTQTFHTDSNSLYMLRRDWRSELPIGGNFYPMTSQAFVEDQSKRITIHSAQPLGVGSLYAGTLNVLVDRKPTRGGKGLSEAVLDNRPTISKFCLQIEHFESTTSKNSSSESSMFPTLTSSFINGILQTPLLNFIIASSVINLDSLPESIFFLNDHLPCDYSVANFRNFIDNGVWNGSGIILHRKATPCKVTDTKLPCSSDVDSLSLHKLFSIQPHDIYKSSLTHFHIYQKLEEDVRLNTMDLESYVIKWK